jgi:hypothetical protein
VGLAEPEGVTDAVGLALGDAVGPGDAVGVGGVGLPGRQAAAESPISPSSR